MTAAVIRDRVLLMQAIGIVPRDLGLVAHEVDVQRIIRAFGEALDRHQLPSEIEDDLLDALRSASIRRRRPSSRSRRSNQSACFVSDGRRMRLRVGRSRPGQFSHALLFRETHHSSWGCGFSGPSSRLLGVQC
jgi:hypothetical protein